MISPTLLLFFRIAEAIWGHFWFHINFWNICSKSVKYVIGILVGVYRIYRVLWHFNNISSSNPWTRYMLPFICVSLNFFLQCCIVFWVQVFYLFDKVFSRLFIFLVAIVNGIFFLIVFLIFHCWYTKMPSISEYWLCILLFCQDSLLRLSIFFGGVYRVFYVYYHVICKQWQFYFLLSNLDAIYFFFLSDHRG